MANPATFAFNWYAESRTPEMETILHQLRLEKRDKVWARERQLRETKDALEDIARGLDTTPWMPALGRRQAG